MTDTAPLPGHAELGFATPDHLASARSLLLDCSGFSGMESLAGREPKVFDGARVELVPGFALIPAAFAAVAAAGPGGSLGRALMAAANRPSDAMAPRAHLAAPQASDNASSGPQWTRSSDRSAGGDEWDGWDEAHESSSQPRAAAHHHRPPVDEGVGENSFESIISALEDSGFGDPKTAEIIRERKAANAKASPRPRR